MAALRAHLAQVAPWGVGTARRTGLTFRRNVAHLAANYARTSGRSPSSRAGLCNGFCAGGHIGRGGHYIDATWRRLAQTGVRPLGTGGAPALIAADANLFGFGVWATVDWSLWCTVSGPTRGESGMSFQNEFR
jgi:hypothetical protein